MWRIREGHNFVMLMKCQFSIWCAHTFTMRVLYIPSHTHTLGGWISTPLHLHQRAIHNCIVAGFSLWYHPIQPGAVTKLFWKRYSSPRFDIDFTVASTLPSDQTSLQFRPRYIFHFIVLGLGGSGWVRAGYYSFLFWLFFPLCFYPPRILLVRPLPSPSPSPSSAIEEKEEGEEKNGHYYYYYFWKEIYSQF